jgi:hypothetical protein
MRGPRCGWLRAKLIAPASQAAALFYGRWFEIAPAVKALLRGDITEYGCKLMATLGVVVNSLGNLGGRLARRPSRLCREGSRLRARWRGAAVDAGAGFRISMCEPLVNVGNGMAPACLCEELAQRALGRYAIAVIREEMPTR